MQASQLADPVNTGGATVMGADTLASETVTPYQLLAKQVVGLLFEQHASTTGVTPRLWHT